MKNNKLLTIDEERQFILRAQAGDQEARNILIECNLGLVKSIAKRYVKGGLEFNELVNEGCFGIVTAITKFDVTKGFRFSTYATWWIRNEISCALIDRTNMFCVPVSRIRNFNKLKRIQNELSCLLGREPTITELALESGYKEKRIKELLAENYKTQSLEVPIQNDLESMTTFEDLSDSENMTTFGDLIADSKNIEEEMIDFYTAHQILSCAKVILPERSYNILKYRMGFVNNRVYTQEEVGKIYGISNNTISVIERKSLKKIRDYLKSNYLTKDTYSKSKGRN